MEQENFIEFIKELFDLDTLHQEYQDNDIHFVIDSKKEGNKLTLEISLIEDKDKKEFEEWLKNVDDDLFSEVLDELKEKDNIYDLESMYRSKDCKKVINKFKAKAKEIATRRIKELKRVLV